MLSKYVGRPKTNINEAVSCPSDALAYGSLQSGKRYGNEAEKDEAIIAAIILRTNSAEQCARQ